MALFSVVTQSERCVEEEPFVGTGSGLARDRVKCKNVGDGCCSRTGRLREAGTGFAS